MECKYIQSQLSSFVDNTLIFPAPIKEHLETCSVCQDELSSIKRTIEFTSSIEEILPPVDFLSLVHEEIKKEAVPALPEYNLSMAKRYIVYGILIISVGLWLAKVFLFEGRVSRVMPVEKIYKTGSQTTSAIAAIPSSSPAIKNKILQLEEKEELISTPLRLNGIGATINPVPMEDTDLAFPESRNILPPLMPQDITTGSFPDQLPLKPRKSVLKIFLDEPIEKEELQEKKEEVITPYNHYALGDFLVRLADYNEVCSAQLRDVVLVYESTKYANPEELEEKRDSIKDIVQGVVSSYDSQRIKQTESLKKELREELNNLLQEGEILQVGFKLVVE